MWYHSGHQAPNIYEREKALQGIKPPTKVWAKAVGHQAPNVVWAKVVGHQAPIYNEYAMDSNSTTLDNIMNTSYNSISMDNLLNLYNLDRLIQFYIINGHQHQTTTNAAYDSA